MLNNKDILEAKENIAGKVHYTPIMKSSILSEKCGFQLFFKTENLQKTGSFKIRGATNRLKKVMEKGKPSGVTTGSSGNHGQAVAYVANVFNVPCTIVMPEDASEAKQAAARGYGAEVIFCGTTSQERIERAQELAEDENYLYIPPYDHPNIMAGQGTTGLEILEQVEGVDVVLVPIGGGGLASGVVTAIKENAPHIKVFGVEPEFSNSMSMSVKEGKITQRKNIKTIADGLRAKQPGDLTFPVIQKYMDDIILVSDKEINDALKLIFQYNKLVVEPSGATAPAAALSGKLDPKCKNVVSIISGGNVDFATYASLLV